MYTTVVANRMLGNYDNRMERIAVENKYNKASSLNEKLEIKILSSLNVVIFAVRKQKLIFKFNYHVYAGQ